MKNISFEFRIDNVKLQTVVEVFYLWMSKDKLTELTKFVVCVSMLEFDICIDLLSPGNKRHSQLHLDKD